ncbi:ATP-binding protein [Achromobacter xylosoxidans]|uniref:ATP-binding protein n=1 Tax=Alcaligenes xylosoxydans xylosoxydans TaxID=85698 RepID=UPI00211B34AF|nr:ATP-binding protein [Achromobacter xylosoxidans]
MPATARLPMILLHLLALALLACILVGTMLSMYWSFSDEVSSYRRRMNAAADRAQIFFDQREALLRSVAGSSVRNTDRMPARHTPRTFGQTGQISVIPLTDDADAYEWALILTRRNRADLATANARIVYTTLAEPGATRLALDDTRHGGHAISPETEKWLYETLAAHHATPDPDDGRAPVVWIRPLLDSTDHLFLYTPLDTTGREQTWVGLEVDDIASVIAAEHPTDGASYALYDSDSRVALHGGPSPSATDSISARLSRDSFGFQGRSWLPHSLALSKAVGEAGWRLVYYVPTQDVLRHGASAFWAVGAVAACLSTVVLLGVRHIREKLVSPAIRYQTALIDSLALNRKIIEVAPIGLSLVRPADGTQVISNEAARHLLDAHDSWREDTRAAVNQAGQHEYQLGDGRTVCLTYAATSYQSENVVICAISDISAQKEVERTLRNAKQAADQANDAKTLFFATISHEIRTPLYGILGTLELLALTPMTSQQQQYLHTMQQSSSTLLRTINDTLDLSRMEAGREDLILSAFSPAEMVEGVVANYAARAQGKGLQIYSISGVGMPAMVTGDLTRLQQILNNLVSNSVKFTEAGRVVLRATASAVEADKVTMRFQVTDTGVGIRAESQAQLFEPYFRAHPGLEQDVTGTGLGLAISRRLVDLMGGSLSVVSEVGLGTSITFTLTLDVTEMEPASPILLRRSAVYVSGAVPEVVANACAWLNKWGAIAIPYRAQAPMQDAGNAVLLQTWPPGQPEPFWTRSKVRVLAPGADQASIASRGSRLGITSLGNPFSIGIAVGMAQQGHEPPLLPPPSAQRVSLGQRILVVEDNAINQVILQEQLEHLGCSATIVFNGREALQRWDPDKYDAVITDINMPILDGYDLTRALRELGYRGTILGVTASAAPETITKGLEAGMNQVLLKPLPILALTATLHAYIEG